MPELPEVETIRRGLERAMAGRTIDDVRILDPRLVAPADATSIEARLRGRRVEAVARRGKYLLLELDAGLVAMHHLRMTGSFAVSRRSAEDGVTRHERATYRLGDVVVRYVDPRRFGTLVVAPREEVEAHLATRLGPEPLEESFTARGLAAAIARRTASIKAVLLDQRVVAGIGNIYADEALFVARVRPTAAAGSLGTAQVEALRAAIVDRLTLAIDVGGSSLRDYRDVEGEPGGMQHRFLAYGRGGAPCTACGTGMATGRIAGRATVWCPRCQRPGTRRRGAARAPRRG